MNSGCSALNPFGLCVAGMSLVTSSHHLSRPRFILTSFPIRFWTITVLTVLFPLSALSTFSLSGTVDPLRHPASHVMTATAFESSSLSLMDSAENPPNTTECTAPILAHASMAIVASGVIGM